MENFNAEQIIKALECCNVINGCKDCPYSHKGKPTDNGECSEKLSLDVLALIKSQEIKIKELTEDVEKYIAQTKELAVELDAMRGAANSYKMHNEKLFEENERLESESDELRDIIRKLHKKFIMYCGTYALGYKIPTSEALKAADQIAKEMLEEIER